jgi:N-acetylglucosamine kinase-like BadF-type ATPase
VDVGGSATRLRAAVLGDGGTSAGAGAGSELIPLPFVTGRPVRVTPGGSDAVDVIMKLVRRFRRAHPEVTVVAAAAGVTGLASLAVEASAIHQVIAAELGAERTAVAADALTAHLGALAGRPGAVVVAGVGAIALGTDLRRRWHRADGWGLVLGDLGSGSWIGARGLRAALAAHDGRPDGASPTLLAMAVQLLGPVADWRPTLLSRADGAQLIASFAPAVAEAARVGDDAAVRTLDQAGVHLAETLAAALVPGVPPLASATGGALTAGPTITDAFRRRFTTLRPDAELVPAAGTPLDGVLLLAQSLTGPPIVDPHEPWLTVRTREREVSRGW